MLQINHTKYYTRDLYYFAESRSLRYHYKRNDINSDGTAHVFFNRRNTVVSQWCNLSSIAFPQPNWQFTFDTRIYMYAINDIVSW